MAMEDYIIRVRFWSRGADKAPNIVLAEIITAMDKSNPVPNIADYAGYEKFDYFTVEVFKRIGSKWA